MASTPQNSRDTFGSNFGIVAAAAGSAVGLGNIWRFPLVATQEGGGAFLLLYVGFVLLIGIPVMLCEFSIGRKAKANAFGSFQKLAPHTPWKLVGFLGILTALVIISFYCTVAGWTLEYCVQATTGTLMHQEDMSANFKHFTADTYRPVIWQILFVIMTGAIVLVGVKKGIEKFTKITMPLLLVMIVIVVIRAITLEGAAEGLKYLFFPDWSVVTYKTAIMALGQSAFSLSIGMGTLITYGSYIRNKEKLVRTTTQIAFADTFVAILSSMMIIPAVFAFSHGDFNSISAGPGLVFEVLPQVFQTMVGGHFFAVLFFLLLAVAALTSTISVLEVIVAYLIEEWNFSRKTATLIATLAAGILGVFTTLSFSSMSNFTIFGMTVFDLFNYISANIMLTTGALLIVLFVGWKMGKSAFVQEVSNNGTLKATLIKIIFFIIRYIAPIAIAIVAFASFFIDGITG